MKIISMSIKTTIFLGLLIGISFPILIAGNYIIYSDKEKALIGFSKYREEMIKNIAFAMSDPLDKFSPNRASLALQIIKQDLRIVKIDVYDNLSESSFIKINIPKREIGNIYINKNKIFKNEEEIGYVQISFSDQTITKELEDKKYLLIKVSIFTFIALLLIMFPLLYIKILLPLERLLLQSIELSHNKLENKFIWSGNDEINTLGRSFELARVSILNLINKLKEKNDELEVLYITDRLTGLYNRYKLDSVLSDEINRAKRYNSIFGIILIDIDYFKSVNDIFGHQIGDTVLVEISDILKENTRSTDTVGRWGGEEFLIIVPHTDEIKIKNIAENLRTTIESHVFKIVGKKTASFGVTIFRNKESIESMINRADEALYKVKKSGRNQVCVA